MTQKPLSFASSGATRGGEANRVSPPSLKKYRPLSPPLAPISLDSSMIMSVDHLLSDLVNEEKNTKFFFGGSRIISNWMINYFFRFRLKESQSFLIYPHNKPVYMLILMSITIYIPFKVTQSLTVPKKNYKKYNKDYIGLSGLLQTIGG